METSLTTKELERPPQARQVAGVPPVYRVGTLRYTLRGLIVLFAWLLWGDFCFVMFESIFNRFLPLFMKDLKASNTLIGVMTGSIAGALNFFFLPHISMWTDRHQSRWGRRIPFLFWSTPCTVAALMMIGFTPELGAWLHARIISPLWPVSVGAVILATLCVLVVMYHFFNMVLVNLFNCLLRDVVPHEVMARFLSSFKIVGTAGSFLFSWCVFPYVLDYRKEVCVGIGLVYLASFLLMCWRVREGEYPPPPPKENQGFLKSYLGYFREILSVPLYRDYFIVNILVMVGSVCVAPFIPLFARNTLGLTMDDIGKIFAWSTLAGGIVYVPLGYLCDRFTPMRVALIALIVSTLTTALAFFLVRDRTGWLVYSMVAMVPGVSWGLAQNATTMVLFPSDKFGQFSSGLSVTSYGCIFVGNYLVGRSIDLAGSNYRIYLLWSLACSALAIIPMELVYRGWKKHGGPARYVPPLPA